jgi:hypothetical protein
MVMDKHMGHTGQQATQVMRFKGIKVRFERKADVMP